MLLFNYCDLHVSQSKKFDSFCHFVFGVIVFKLNSGWHGATLIVECLWLCLLFPTETGCYRIPYREETNSWIVKVWQQGSKALFSYVPLILRGIGCNVDRSQPHCWKKKKNEGLCDVATVTNIVPLMTASAHIFSGDHLQPSYSTYTALILY